MFRNSTIYPKRSALSAYSPFEEQAQALLAYSLSHSFLILHFIYYISQRSNAKNCFRITGYSVKVRSQVQTITRAILPRDQLPSVSNSKRGWSCKQIFDSSATVLNPLVGTKTDSRHDSYSTLYRFLYWFWEKKSRLFCSLDLLQNTRPRYLKQWAYFLLSFCIARCSLASCNKRSWGGHLFKNLFLCWIQVCISICLTSVFIITWRQVSKVESICVQATCVLSIDNIEHLIFI